MATPPSPDEAETPDTTAGGTWVSSTLRAVSSTSKFLGIAASEWLPSLLDQPTQPPFEYNASFGDEFGRTSRLIVFVLLISGILVGGVNLLSGQINVTDTLRSAFGVIAIAVIIALVYKPFAYISGVRLRPRGTTDAERSVPPRVLSTRQVVFSVLYTFVPWLPIFAFIRASVTSEGALQDFFLIAPFICFLYMVFNFVKAVKMLTDCSMARIWISLLLPVFISLLYLVWSSG